MDEIEERGDLLPNSDLPKAITYIRKEWNALVDIFIYGNTQIENNTVYPKISMKWHVLTGSFSFLEGTLCSSAPLWCRRDAYIVVP